MIFIRQGRPGSGLLRGPMDEQRPNNNEAFGGGATAAEARPLRHRKFMHGMFSEKHMEGASSPST